MSEKMQGSESMNVSRTRHLSRRESSRSGTETVISVASSKTNNSNRKYAPRNKVLRNKGDPEAVRQAKANAKAGRASLAVQKWLFPPEVSKPKDKLKGLPMDSPLRYSDVTPPVILNSKTIREAVDHLSRDPKLLPLIQRVGAESLIRNIGESNPTEASLFDQCLRSITFVMVSIDAGNAFMRKLAIKVGVCFECMKKQKRDSILNEAIHQMQEGRDDFNHLTADDLLNRMLEGQSGKFLFTTGLLRPLIDQCDIINGKLSGYPHLCGGKPVKCGKNDDHSVFLEKAREHALGKGTVEVSASYSRPKAEQIVSLVKDFESGKISAQELARSSDRKAAQMLKSLKGIGDWSATSVLIFYLNRANIMSYGDLTLRNYLNDLYDISHNKESETRLQSAADFPDSAENRNLIDALATRNGWEPYRSVILYLMYHLQEENLVLV